MGEGLKLLIVGGYGTFGGHIVELLENEPRLTVVIAGRSVQSRFPGGYAHARTHMKRPRAADSVSMWKLDIR